MRNQVIILTVLIVSITILQADDKIDITTTADSMSWDNYWAHVSYFASDELEGRDIASRGFNLAAKYTAEKFQAAGLKPFGDDSTYFQKVPFNRASLVQSSFDLTFTNGKSTVKTSYGENVSAVLNTDASAFDGTAKIVFVGYGNIIPEAGINDYANLDVRDKVVVIAHGSPESLVDSLKLGLTSKLKLAEEQGAKGVVAFAPGKRRAEKKTFQNYHRWLGKSRLYISDPEVAKKRYDLDMVYFIKESIARKLLHKGGLNLRRALRKMKKGEFRSQEINTSLTCSYEMTNKNMDCKNVVALLPGTDSLLQHEYIVVGAHLDHVGIGPAVEGDSIRNGLWDNATGSGATISIAETFHSAGIQPKRSIVFINYTGEEKGLLGSHYFANTYGVDSINVVVNVNIDMLGGPIETSDITPLGYNHSSVSEAVDRVAEDLGLTLADPTKVEKRFIHRSDQMSFMKLGIPLLNFNYGKQALNPEIDPDEKFEEWMQTRYHTPSDDLNQPYDVGGFFTALKANFLATYYLANEVEKIEWYEDSWVYEKHVKPALESSRSEN